MRHFIATVAVTLCLTLSADDALAQELKGDCPVGASVTDRKERTGIVKDSKGSYCHVTFPDGTVGYYPSFMLRLSGKPRVDPNEVAAVQPGRYTCYAGSNYTFMDINIKDPTSYADKKGAVGFFSYNPGTQIITFSSGTFQGQFAKLLDKKKIGLASKPTTFFATVCDLKG